MTKNLQFDWYDNLKIEIVKLAIEFFNIKMDMVYTLISNRWITEDINLEESTAQLQELLDITNFDFQQLITEINTIEKEYISQFYSMEDLLDEFEYIKENIDLVNSYFGNMMEYMSIIDDYQLSPELLKNKWEDYLDKDELCFNQICINHEQLKQLRKERIDKIE